MILTATIRNDSGEALGMLILKDKTFKSGRVGWFGVGKVEIDGVRYQAQSQLVRIGEPVVTIPVKAAAADSDA